MSKVTIENARGVRKEISEQSWKLMSSKSESGDTRKGWTLVRNAPDKTKASAAPKVAKSAGAKEHPFGYLPPELQEEQAKKAAQLEASMTSGEPGAGAAADAGSEQGNAPGSEKSDAASGTSQGDNLGLINGIGPKVVEALAAVGIKTYSDLAKANAADISKALDAANMAPKKAQIPSWKMKAAELAKGAGKAAQEPVNPTEE